MILEIRVGIYLLLILHVAWARAGTAHRRILPGRDHDCIVGKLTHRTSLLVVVRAGCEEIEMLVAVVRWASAK